MGTTKGKPRGYYQKILAMDCETTGLASNCDDPSYNPKTGDTYQSVSWGLIVADAQTLKPIEKMYIEIQWDGESVWDKRAEKIHGLTKEHLKENGFTQSEAVEAIGSLLMKHWGPTGRIGTLGHNVATFDLWFFKRLFRKFDIELSFGNRHVDTSSIGFVNWETYTSDALFEAVGFEERGEHNALEDARHALESDRITRLLFKNCIE